MQKVHSRFSGQTAVDAIHIYTSEELQIAISQTFRAVQK